MRRSTARAGRRRSVVVRAPWRAPPPRTPRASLRPMRALFGLLAIGAVACVAPAATLAPSPAGLPTAAAGSDLVYLADQVGTQGASIVAMPSGAVIGRVEGYAYPAPYNQVGPRFGLFASTQDGRVRVARVTLGTGRASVIDA